MLKATIVAMAAVQTPFTKGPRTSMRTPTALQLRSELTLYGNRNSRSPLIEWYLVEINKQYTHSEDRSSNPNPFGKIPGLRDDKVELFESGAILLYLSDKYGESNTPEKRADAAKWIVWANAELDGVLFTRDIEEFLVGNQFSVADVAGAEKRGGRGGNKKAVASYLLFIPLFHPNFDASRFPNVLQEMNFSVQYMNRCASRPAFQKTMGTNALQYLQVQLAKKPASNIFNKLF